MTAGQNVSATLQHFSSSAKIRYRTTSLRRSTQKVRGRSESAAKFRRISVVGPMQLEPGSAIHVLWPLGFSPKDTRMRLLTTSGPWMRRRCSRTGGHRMATTG